jgi:hypothetical protein
MREPQQLSFFKTQLPCFLMHSLSTTFVSYYYVCILDLSTLIERTTTSLTKLHNHLNISWRHKTLLPVLSIGIGNPGNSFIRFYHILFFLIHCFQWDKASYTQRVKRRVIKTRYSFLFFTGYQLAN